MRLCNPLHLRQVWRPQAIACVVYRHYIYTYIYTYTCIYQDMNLRRTSSISWWSWILHSVLARLWKLSKTEIAGASDYRDCHEGRAIECVLGFTLQRPARVAKTIEQVLKSHSSFCYSYSIKGCKCRGCGNATWLECWGACSCCSSFSFLFLHFFSISLQLASVLARLLSSDFLKRRAAVVLPMCWRGDWMIPGYTGCKSHLFNTYLYIFIHIYIYLYIFIHSLFDIVWQCYSSVTKLLHRCYIAFGSVLCGCRNALREFLASPSVAKMQSSILSWRCAGRSIEQLLHSAIYFAAVPWSSCFLDVFLMFSLLWWRI